MTAPPSEQRRAKLLTEAEAAAPADAVLAGLLAELDEAVTAAERRVASAPLHRRPDWHRPGTAAKRTARSRK
jgi:hypothetical protein